MVLDTSVAMGNKEHVTHVRRDTKTDPAKAEGGCIPPSTLHPAQPWLCDGVGLFPVASCARVIPSTGFFSPQEPTQAAELIKQHKV